MEENQLKLVNQAATYLAVVLIETNAETFTYKLTNFHKGEEVFGDFEITVKKVKSQE